MKVCGNCALPQNFHTRNFGKITAFYAMSTSEDNVILTSDFNSEPEKAKIVRFFKRNRLKNLVKYKIFSKNPENI